MAMLQKLASSTCRKEVRSKLCVILWLRLTEEVRELLAGMGSSLIKSVKVRDNWMFAGRAGSVNRSLYEKISGSLPPPPPPPARVLWCWKCPLLCLPVRQLSMTRKPMLTRAGRGRWRWRAVLQGPKLSRCQSKEEKKACLGVAGLFWMSHVVPGWCIVTVVCPSGICDHCF